MQILPPSNSAKHDTRNCGITGQSEGFFNCDDGEQKEVGQEVISEDQGWQVCRQKTEDYIGQGVVVMGGEGIGRGDGVEEVVVEGAKEVLRAMMEEKTVRVVLDDL